MIEVVGLTKSYGNIKAVKNVSFEIRQGEVFGLLGPNGAGKTTIVKILTTLTRPDSGRCSIDGFDVLKQPIEIKKRVGVVPQENNLDRELTAYENLLIYCKLHKVSDSEKKMEDILRMVDLWERRNSSVNTFSGGMQRRLLLARALLPEPSVLFLDEPSIGLDPQIRRNMWEIVRKAIKEGRTVVITTHYIEEAMALCDKVGILSKGALIAFDTPNNLKTTVGNYVAEYIDVDGKLIQYLYKSREDAMTTAELIGNHVTIRGSNLEDVFIKLTGERIE